MKKLTKRIWMGILSGVALIFGNSCQCHWPSELEEVYGPPPPEVNDTIDEKADEPYNLEEEEPIEQENALGDSK